MLEDDLAREEAEAEIDLIFKALAFIDGLSLDTSIDGSTVSAHLNLSFRQPD